MKLALAAAAAGANHCRSQAGLEKQTGLRAGQPMKLAVALVAARLFAASFRGLFSSGRQSCLHEGKCTSIGAGYSAGDMENLLAQQYSGLIGDVGIRNVGAAMGAIPLPRSLCMPMKDGCRAD